MLKEIYNDYMLTTCCKRKFDDRYSVEVIIEKEVNGIKKKDTFLDTKISLILQQEAEKESINFGKNVIKNKLITF
jgi:hypothetical protein